MATTATRALPLQTFELPMYNVDIGQQSKADTMPPGHKAKYASVQTFSLPPLVDGSPSDAALGRAMIDAWRVDGIFQIRTPESDRATVSNAFKANKAFFALSPEEKARCVDEQSYSGYIASGEEITDGIADYSEIYTVTKDLPLSDSRVQAGWPCHGPCPWPSDSFQVAISNYMEALGSAGERALELIALGLGLPSKIGISRHTQDGWHNLRVLRYPKIGDENGKGQSGRGTGSHTDYGLIALLAQEDVGGLFIRRPSEDENFANWQKSTAGMKENDDGWWYIPPEPNTLALFPGKLERIYC